MGSVWKADNSCRVLATTDQGKTFQLRGTAHIAALETRGPHEEMIVERKDGSLWMLVRVQGMAGSISHDGGKTVAIKKLVSRSPIEFHLARQYNALPLVHFRTEFCKGCQDAICFYDCYSL